MADRSLHGNGVDCPACALRREAAILDGGWRQTVPCNKCRARGRLARPTRAIIGEAVRWARAHYWPAVEARWRAQGWVPSPPRDKAQGHPRALPDQLAEPVQLTLPL